MLRSISFILLAGTDSRPIDDISTWVQYGESVCWVVADWNACCAPEYGPAGNPECWVAFPLSYQNCCLEHWKVCDEVTDSRDRTTDQLSASWHMFYESCGRGQELLNSLQMLWSVVGFQQELCKASPKRDSSEVSEACVSEREHVKEVWQKLQTQRSALAGNNWQDVLDGVVQLPSNTIEPQFGNVLQEWSPQSFAELLSDLSETYFSTVNLAEKLQLFRDHLEKFRDSMLNVLYMYDLYDSSHSLSRSHAGCGEICITDKQSEQNSSPLRKKIHCNALLNSMVTNQTDQTDQTASIPPPRIPANMMSAYTMNGQVPVVSHSTIRQALGFSGGVFPSKEQPEEDWMWTYEAIEKLIARAYDYKLTPGPHSLDRVKTLTDVLADLPELVRQQHWIVWGDSKHFEWWKPWMESLLLSFGAGTVSSIVPNPSRYDVSSPHPQLRPMNLQHAMQDAPFHGIVLMGVASAGVGRHGDNLNPNEDLQQAAASWCLLRSGGILIAPSMSDSDLLRWPLGRVYGPKRWPHLVANFELLRVYDGVAAVLRKP